MSDEPESLTLRMLRRMDEKIDRVLSDNEDIKHRLMSLERGVASLSMDIVNLSHRVDRVDTRLSRMERRLDLADTPL